MYVSEDTASDAEEVFRRKGGTLRTSRALELGIHPRTLYHLRDSGRLEQLTRGVFRLTDLPPLSDPDLVAVATRLPEAVVCLISALAFHEVTTQVPHEVHVALARTKWPSSFDYPPVRVYRFSGEAFATGVEVHEIDEVPVRIYSAAKTVADCFRFRNRLGKDLAIEALKLSLERKMARPDELLHYARICRVEPIMTPYLEVLV